MKRTLKRLDSVHARLSAAISATHSRLFSERPAQNEWNIAEVIQHLCLVEERVLEELQKSLDGPPAKVGFLKKLVPMRIVSLRLIRVKAPRAVRPGNPPAMDELIKNYDRARANLKKLCAKYGRERLKKVSVKHPFLGVIDGAAAVSMVAFHEQRHYKQIREILKKLTS